MCGGRGGGWGEIKYETKKKNTAWWTDGMKAGVKEKKTRAFGTWMKTR